MSLLKTAIHTPEALMFNYYNHHYKGSMQNKFSVKVGILSQGGGGGSDPIPTFIKHCFYGIFDPFLPKISEKFTEKIPTFGEGGGSSWFVSLSFSDHFTMLRS